MTIPRCCAVVAVILTFDASAAEAQCSYSVTPAVFSVPSTSTPLSVSVVTGTQCSWTATSSASWITVTSAETQTGMGSVSFVVAASTGAPRTGTVTVAGQLITVNQGANSCSFTVSPLSFSIGTLSTSRTLSVTTGTQCTWSATTIDPWITVTNPGAGVGISSVTFSVTANGGPERIGTLTVAGKAVTVTQAGTSGGTVLPPPSGLRVVR